MNAQIKSSTPDERRRWLEQWADAHPDETIDAAKEALIAEFGEAINTQAASVIMREARRRMMEHHNLSRIRSALPRLQDGHDGAVGALVADSMSLSTLTAPALLHLVAKMMKRERIRKIELKDGSISLEMDLEG